MADEHENPDRDGVQPDRPTPEQSGRSWAWREWTMIGVGLAAVLAVLAVIVSVSALGSSNPTTTTMLVQPASSAQVSSAAKGPVEAVRLVIKSGAEHGKLGDGKWHDAYLPADFTVHAGARVMLTVYNYDNSPHSFIATSLSPTSVISETIPPGSASAPSKTAITFTAPAKAGAYAWWCSVPCDPWSMAHSGYMRGVVTVVA